MDTLSKGGEGVKPGPETMPGITVEEVGLDKFNIYGPNIAALGYDVLNTRNNRNREGSYPERKKAMYRMSQEMKQSGDHSLGLIAKKGEDVIGFISIKKGGGIAQVEEMWVNTPSRMDQKCIIANLIDTALQHLGSGSTPYHKLHIVPAEPSGGFEGASVDPTRGRRLEIGRVEPQAEPQAELLAVNDNEPPRHDLEKAA